MAGSEGIALSSLYCRRALTPPFLQDLPFKRAFKGRAFGGIE